MPTRDPARGGRHPLRWVARLVVIAIVVGVVVTGFVAWHAAQRAFFTASCAATASGTTFTFTPEQTANAALISAVAVKRGLPARAATIAIATAIQESKLRNLTYGDRDSVGLFQQRPSQGWGTREQILDAVYSTGKFYDALVKVPGYATGAITKVAQQVQRSAYPEAYADHEQQGRVLASTLTGQSPAGLGCRLADPTVVSSARSVTADLGAQMGTTGAESSGTVRVTASDPTHAWAAAQWAVARAEAYGVAHVEVAGRTWDRGNGDSALTWGTGGSSDGTTVIIRLGAA
ncbi:MAG: hypothetical protein M3Y71_12225 [Actinomycetota bacterium]|nr:hypothetical protein [Actinomycetota bacterium]